MLLEITYNEGWNTYVSAALARHIPIYPAGYHWTVVNYPVLSFFTSVQLGKITHEYLFTARVLSLVSLALCCLFAGMIVHRLTRSRRYAVLTGLMCLLIFCANAIARVGMDDPQMFAHAFFMAGFLLYVCYRDKKWALVAIALMFVIGGNIKHNLIDFPLAIAIDLFLVSRRRLVLLLGLLIAFEVPAFYLNLYIGGPAFLTHLLVPREYSWIQPFSNGFDFYIVLLIPMVVAFYMAARCFRNPERRVLAIFFAVSLGVGMFFGGGVGVSFNTFFSNTFATVLLLGLFMHSAGVPLPGWPGSREEWNAAATLMLFLWMLIPMRCEDALYPIDNWRKLHTEQAHFHQQVDFIRERPGPALCESLLRCYYAGKPYLVDPFNATSLIRAGKLDENVMLNAIRAGEFSTIQFNRPPRPDGLPYEVNFDRFTEAELEAIRNNYTPEFEQPDGTIYVPRHPVERAKLNGDFVAVQ